MKKRVLELARRTVEAFLREHCADTTLEVLWMYPDFGSYGDEVLLIFFKYDDSEGAEPPPDVDRRMQLKARLRAELQDVEVDTFPVVSFIAESEIDEEPE